FYLHGKTAMPRRRVAVEGLGYIEPFQSVTRQAPLLPDLGADSRELLPAPGEAPTFDQNDVAVRRPLLWQLERKGEVGNEARIHRRWVRPMKQLPDRLDQFPRGRASNLFEEPS